MTASRYVPPALRPLEAAKAVYRGPRDALAAMGHLITFLVRSIAAVYASVPLDTNENQNGRPRARRVSPML